MAEKRWTSIGWFPTKPSQQMAQALLTGLGGAALLVPIELWTLRPLDFHVVWASISLLLTLGFVMSLILLVSEWTVIAVRRYRTHGLMIAAIRSLASLIVFIPVSRHLFEGAFASSLPGAAHAPYILPALGFGCLTIFVWWLSHLLENFHCPPDLVVQVQQFASKTKLFRLRQRRIFAAFGFALLAFATELINRSLLRSEYPDVHTMGLVVAILFVGFSFRLGLRTTLVLQDCLFFILAAIFTVNTMALFSFGLATPETRSAITNRGMHTRMLVRLARSLHDADQDGFSGILGGPDCNDNDPAIHPKGKEIIANTVDENCDGVVAQTDTAIDYNRNEQTRKIHMEEWLMAPTVQTLRERLRGHHVLLVTVDALRGDILGNNSQTRAEFPHLSTFMDEACVFTRAFAPSAGTDLSLASLFTSRVDPFHNIQITLAEAFAARNRIGYAVIPSEVLRYAGRTLLTRGLHDFHRLINDLHQRDIGSYTTSARTTKLGLQYLDQHFNGPTSEHPFFLWLHYFDVHEHHEVGEHDRHLQNYLAGRPMLPEKTAKYRAMLGLIDHEMGLLKQELQIRNLWDRTVIVFVSDHGESLGEHPRLPNNHGHVLYNPLIHVPMLIRIPGITPSQSDVAVSIVDLMPTLLALDDARLPDDLDGVVLLPQILPDAPNNLRNATRPIILNESDQYGVIVWPFKALFRADDNIIELFNLALDFGETQNLAGSHRGKVDELLQIYQSAPTVQLDRTTKGRRLREQEARNTEKTKLLE